MQVHQPDLFCGAPAPRRFDEDALGFLIRGFGEKYRIRDGGEVSNRHGEPCRVAQYYLVKEARA